MLFFLKKHFHSIYFSLFYFSLKKLFFMPCSVRFLHVNPLNPEFFTTSRTNENYPFPLCFCINYYVLLKKQSIPHGMQRETLYNLQSNTFCCIMPFVFKTKLSSSNFRRFQKRIFFFSHLMSCFCHLIAFAKINKIILEDTA